MPRILDAALSTLWAITPDGLDALRVIYEQALSRTGSFSSEDIERFIAENEDVAQDLHLSNAVMQGQPHTGSSKYTFLYPNGVAVMNLIGPIYPRANMMTSSGAVSLQQFTKEFVMAYEDPEVAGIVMNIDSPGGDARGLGDASNLMYGYSKKRKKPVKSFIAGYGASAAYYIGAISQEITGSQSSIVGSIGTVLSGTKKKEGEYEIVSSQSPYKRPDPGTEEGQSIMQEMVNDLAQVFVEDVAMFRNVTVEKVLSDYGQGKTLIGPRAKKQGLIDSIGTLDSVIEATAKQAQDKSYRQIKPRVKAKIAEILSFTNEEIEDMGLKDMVSKFSASNKTLLEDVENEQAQPDAPADESETSVASEQGQETLGADPQTPAVQSREELEEQFSDAAELFATQITIDSRIFPAQQPYAASDLLNARIDDKLYGGKISFVNATGEVVEGTREEAVRARYAAMPKHTMTQKAIKGLKEGSVEGRILSEADSESNSKKEDDGPISAERRTELLSRTTQGQNALAKGSNK